MIKDVQQEILRLKKEKGICILAHSYVAKEILEIADFTGDSYALSVKAKSAPQNTVIMVGVRFMAETVKILSPEKKVILAHAEAGCAMADQMDRDTISIVKAQYPDYKVVCYINTTAELKTICDVCVTSSSAVKICSQIPDKNILFIPDCNLGAYVAEQLPDKNFKLLQGGCPVHAAVNEEDVLEAKAKHPNALLLVHPECTQEVVKHADYVGSTSGIMEFAKKSDAKEFIIGTELSITENLQYECPDKMFYNLSMKLMCKNMKLNTLYDVYNAIVGRSGEEIVLDDDTVAKAKRCIDEMIRLGG